MIDGDIEYYDIVAGVLQGDTLEPYLFIICLDYVLRASIDKIRENGFELTKKRSRRYPAKTITDADYADDIAILANTPVQAETLLHSLERAAAGIGFHVNAHKTEYMCYNQTGDISTLDGTPLKLVDKFLHITFYQICITLLLISTIYCVIHITYYNSYPLSFTFFLVSGIFRLVSDTFYLLSNTFTHQTLPF